VKIGHSVELYDYVAWLSKNRAENRITGNRCFKLTSPRGCPGTDRTGERPPHKLSPVRTMTWNVFRQKIHIRKTRLLTMSVTSPTLSFFP